MKDIDSNYFIKVCNESFSMASAASKLNLHFNTFKRIAIKLHCYIPNQGCNGSKGYKSHTKIKIEDILNGKHPYYQTFKLKKRLLLEGYLTNKCSICQITEWNSLPFEMELDHIDGNRTNHLLDNLRLLCPNCHAQTSTYRAKNIK